MAMTKKSKISLLTNSIDEVEKLRTTGAGFHDIRLCHALCAGRLHKIFAESASVHGYWGAFDLEDWSTTYQGEYIDEATLDQNTVALNHDDAERTDALYFGEARWDWEEQQHFQEEYENYRANALRWMRDILLGCVSLVEADKDGLAANSTDIDNHAIKKADEKLPDASANDKQFDQAEYLMNNAPSQLATLLDFMGDADHGDLKAILQRRCREVDQCLRTGAFLSTIILLGSILEGILYYMGTVYKEEVIQRHEEHKSRNENFLQKDWEKSLQGLIDTASKMRWIRVDARAFSAYLQDYRNIIHPSVHQKNITDGKINGVAPSRHVCDAGISMLHEVVREIQSNSLLPHQPDSD